MTNGPTPQERLPVLLTMAAVLGGGHPAPLAPGPVISPP